MLQFRKMPGTSVEKYVLRYSTETSSSQARALRRLVRNGRSSDNIENGAYTFDVPLTNKTFSNSATAAH